LAACLGTLSSLDCDRRLFFEAAAGILLSGNDWQVGFATLEQVDQVIWSQSLNIENVAYFCTGSMPKLIGLASDPIRFIKYLIATEVDVNNYLKRFFCSYSTFQISLSLLFVDQHSWSSARILGLTHAIVGRLRDPFELSLVKVALILGGQLSDRLMDELGDNLHFVTSLVELACLLHALGHQYSRSPLKTETLTRVLKSVKQSNMPGSKMLAEAFYSLVTNINPKMALLS
jgi:hypothetical protein